MENHAVVSGIVSVAVGLPVPLAHVYLHIALDQAHPFHFQQSVPEVGTGGVAGAAGVEDPYPEPVGGAERCLLRRPALPQLGKQPFGYVQVRLGSIGRARFFYRIGGQIQNPQSTIRYPRII